jgi:hypothetical protein
MEEWDGIRVNHDWATGYENVPNGNHQGTGRGAIEDGQYLKEKLFRIMLINLFAFKKIK